MPHLDIDDWSEDKLAKLCSDLATSLIKLDIQCHFIFEGSVDEFENPQTRLVEIEIDHPNFPAVPMTPKTAFLCMDGFIVTYCKRIRNRCQPSVN